MSKTYSLKADQREAGGKGAARAVRRDHKVPAVIYGDKKEPVSIALSSKDINLEYNKGHMFTNICNLNVGGTDHLVLARDVQLDPVRDVVLHVDFLRVTPRTMIHVKVPVHYINEEDCPGLTINKGVLNVGYHDLEIVCQATSIPEAIEVDLSGKDIGDSVHIQDLKLPAGVKPASNRNLTLATINEPKRVVEETPVAAEGAAEGAEGAEAAPAADAAKKPEGDKK
jgi:large subunit ribosomal protein L25